MNYTEVTMWIPHGYDNRISRKELCFLTGYSDRLVREMIERSNSAGESPIISADGGYFVPNFDDETDRYHANVYLLKEEHRISSRIHSLHKLVQIMRGENNEDRKN